MLTFRRALVVAVAVLTVLFLLRSSHPRREPTHVRNADQLPKPPSLTRPTPELQTLAKQGSAQQPVHDIPASFELVEAPRKKPAYKQHVSANDMRKRPLREQLQYQFPYDVEAKFPAFIWQTWKYTPASGDFNPAFRDPEASWTALHPTFVHEVITDDVAVDFVRHLYAAVPDIIEAYDALPVPVLKADFFRYLVLLARGGIYSDIDTMALKSAADWIPTSVPADSYGLVIGIEADPDRPDWADWYARRIQFCQWTIQAKPGHPVLVDVVANITQETLQRKAEGHLTKATNGIIEFTGPGVWTDSVFAYFNDPDYFDNTKVNVTWEKFTGLRAPVKLGDVIVLPITSFSPGVGQMGAGGIGDPLAYVRHNFEGKPRCASCRGLLKLTTLLGSWKPESERHIG